MLPVSPRGTARQGRQQTPLFGSSAHNASDGGAAAVATACGAPAALLGTPARALAPSLDDASALENMDTPTLEKYARAAADQQAAVKAARHAREQAKARAVQAQLVESQQKGDALAASLGEPLAAQLMQQKRLLADLQAKLADAEATNAAVTAAAGVDWAACEAEIAAQRAEVQRLQPEKQAADDAAAAAQTAAAKVRVQLMVAKHSIPTLSAEELEELKQKLAAAEHKADVQHSTCTLLNDKLSTSARITFGMVKRSTEMGAALAARASAITALRAQVADGQARLAAQEAEHAAAVAALEAHALKTEAVSTRQQQQQQQQQPSKKLDEKERAGEAAQEERTLLLSDMNTAVGDAVVQVKGALNSLIFAHQRGVALQQNAMGLVLAHQQGASAAAAASSRAPRAAPQPLLPHNAAAVGFCREELQAMLASSGLLEGGVSQRLLQEVLQKLQVDDSAAAAADVIAVYVFEAHGKCSKTMLPKTRFVWAMKAVKQMAAALLAMRSDAEYQAWLAATPTDARPGQAKLALFKRVCGFSSAADGGM